LLARLHHPVPVPQQLPKIAILQSSAPKSAESDLPSSIINHQSQNQLCIVAIRLLLAYSPGSAFFGSLN
jgi:hypothetical protein